MLRVPLARFTDAALVPVCVSTCAFAVAARHYTTWDDSIVLWHVQHSIITCHRTTHVYCQINGHCLLPTLWTCNELPPFASPMTISPMQDMMERDRQNARSNVAQERARAAAVERDAESASCQADARGRQLQHDLDNAHSEVNLPIFCLSASRKSACHAVHACRLLNLVTCSRVGSICAVSLSQVQHTKGLIG